MIQRSKTACLCLIAAATVLSQGGCENNTAPAVSVFGPTRDSERWTILCRRIDGPGHVDQAELYARMLKQVPQLQADRVRVSSDADASTIRYGEYRKVASPDSDQLVFPPEFIRDIEFIRSLSPDGVTTPFFTAQPEPLSAETPVAHPEWEATRSKGTHGLLIAMFYNTPTFLQRREAAEQYVEILRQEGFSAYFYHEPVKSYVFVGDFAAEDVIRTPQGLRPGPRVEQMIARREDEFRHFSENGHYRKHLQGDGQEIIPLSQVVPMPREELP